MTGFYGREFDDDGNLVFDPDDPLAPVKEALKDAGEDKRLEQAARAVRAMAASGYLDAVTEELVRDYVVAEEKVLRPSAFRAIIREARPHPLAKRSHVHTPQPPAEEPETAGCEAEGCEITPPAWAKGADILGVLARHLWERSGLTGEERNAKLTYLVVASRRLRQPASAAIKGLSSAGKSYTVECVLRAFPASAVIVMTAMSEHALIYMRESFAHRTLVLYEATALREGREKNEGNQTAMFIRTLLSEGRIVYPTVQKDEQGNLVTVTIEKEGPTNFLVTTTAASLHNENETRMLSLAANDSKAQTKAVLKAIATGKKRAGADFADWHDLDHWLGHQTHDVVVPYAEYLAEEIPPVAVRLRRDFATLLALIETHAIIHQADRDTDENGSIVATPADYYAVRDLVADLMSEAVGTTVSATIRETVDVVARLAPPEGVTVKKIAEHLNVQREAAQYRVQNARKGGYIVNLEERGMGFPARYAIGSPLPGEVILLPAAIGDGTHTPQVHTPAETPEPQVTGGCEGVSEQRRGEAPQLASSTSCPDCGEPWDSIFHAQLCPGE